MNSLNDGLVELLEEHRAPARIPDGEDPGIDLNFRLFDPDINRGVTLHSNIRVRPTKQLFNQLNDLGAEFRVERVRG